MWASVVPPVSVRQDLVDDVTQAIWQAVLSHPQFVHLTPRAFPLFRQIIGNALQAPMEMETLVPEVADHVGFILEELTGGTMPRGPLEVLVENVMDDHLRPSSIIAPIRRARAG